MSALEKAIAQQRGTAVSRERTPYEIYRGQLDKLRPEILAMVGKESADRFVRVCLNAVQANPDLLAADRKSLHISCMRAAQDRLMPDGRESVLNVYNTKVKAKDGQPERWVAMVQYLPMVGGLVKKLYDSGHVTFVDAVAVYEKDEFEYERGDEPRIRHKPYNGDEAPGKVVAAYVVAKLKNGEVKREVMWRREIEAVREASKAPNGLMWKDFYDQGAIKSVIKRAYKQLPNYYEMESVIQADNQATGMTIEGESSVVPSGTDLQQLVDGKLEKDLQQPTQPAGGAQPAAAEGAQPAGAQATTGAQPEGTATTAAGVGNQSPPPKAGDPGTPEIHAKLLAAMESCSDADVLDIKRDECNFYTWDAVRLKELEAAYQKRRAELAGAG